MALRSRLSPQQVVGTVYVSAMFMSIIDTTIVNVALPALARQFRVPPSRSVPHRVPRRGRVLTGGLAGGTRHPRP